MRKELDEALCAKYPLIFVNRHGDMRTTAMRWGFNCGDGWAPLIDKLCYMIQWWVDNPQLTKDPATGLYTVIVPREQVVASQVKEKFGTLRFYVNAASDAVYSYIGMAELFSGTVCESCGATVGVATDDGGGYWVKTLCGVCWEAEKAKRAER